MIVEVEKKTEEEYFTDKMRKLLLFLLLFCAVEMTAQIVRYKPYGCKIEFSVKKEGSGYLLFAEVRSGNLRFTKNPVIKYKNFRGEVVTLTGEPFFNESNTNAYIIGHVVISSKELSSAAQFRVRPDQFAVMSNGIRKISINTYPEDHVKTFEKDKLGKRIYKLYEIAYSRSLRF